MVQANINFSPVEQAAVGAFRDTMQLLGREFTAVITEVGAFPGFPDSDIIDTGDLKARQQADIQDTSATFTWPVDYSLYVHEGYTLRNGQTQPGRPWTRAALQRFDLQAKYGAVFKAKLNG